MTAGRGRRLWGLVPGVLLLVFTPTAAAATAPTLPPGVHGDPGSPAAKEYAIPLTQARDDAGNNGSQGHLFGSGITKARGGRPPDTARSTGEASAPTTTNQSRTTSQRVQSGRVDLKGAVPPRRVLRASSSGVSGIVWMLGAAALVLALGGLGGAAVARRHGGAGPGSSS